MKLYIYCIYVLGTYISLHEKPYFPGPGIYQKAQRDQLNIIFPSTFWVKERPNFLTPKSLKQKLFKAQNMNFPVISKYHLFIKFLTQKRPYFLSPENSKQELSSNQ